MCTGLCKYRIDRDESFEKIPFRWSKLVLELKLIKNELHFQRKYSKRRCFERRSNCAVFAAISTKRNWISTIHLHFVQTRQTVRLQRISSGNSVRFFLTFHKISFKIFSRSKRLIDRFKNFYFELISVMNWRNEHSKPTISIESCKTT